MPHTRLALCLLCFLFCAFAQGTSTLDVLRRIWIDANGPLIPANITNVTVFDAKHVVSLTNLTSLSIGSWSFITPLGGVNLTVLGQMARLNTLTLNGVNRVIGSVSDLTSQNLSNLNLIRCNLSGTFPATVCNLRNLKTLNLQSNRLNGTLDIARNCSLWNTNINLGYNQFTGEIPSFLFSSSFKTVDLSSNKGLTLSPPFSFPLAYNLTSLTLNSFNWKNLSVTFFTRLPNLTSLSIDSTSLPLSDYLSVLTNIKSLSFQKNSLTTLPSMVNLNLSILNINGNNFNATLQDFVGLLPASLTQLFMDGYRGVGSLDVLATRFPKLKILSANAFPSSKNNQTLPSSFDNLGLTSLSLSNWNLVGTIPSTWSNLRNLTQLDLRDVSNNNLTGAIPSFFGVSTMGQLTSLNLQNNNFTSVEDGAIIGLKLATCNITQNRLPCYSNFILRDTCLVNQTLCEAREIISTLYGNVSISSSDGKNILSTYSSSNEIVQVISAVVTALLRTTSTFTYSTVNLTVDLQTYDGKSAALVNANRNFSVDIPSSAVSYQKASVCLSSVVSTSSLSIYNESIRGRLIGAQVYDEKGREVEIQGVTEKINITMGYIDDIPSNQKAVCQWWNEGQRIWSCDGCDLHIDEVRLAVCQCTHLTNFSIAVVATSPSGTSTRTAIIIAVCCAVGGLFLISLASVLIYRAYARRKYRAMEDIGMGSIVTGVQYEEKIAESKESQVWKGTHRETTAVAVKKMKRMEAKRFGEECQLMKSLHHPNVVQYLGHNMAEWMTEGSLQDYERSHSMTIRSIYSMWVIIDWNEFLMRGNRASDVCKALSYISSMGQVHTAVVAKKILISGRETVTAKLACVSCLRSEGEPAPEIVGEGMWRSSGHVWSVGILLTAMTKKMDLYGGVNGTDSMTSSLIEECTQKETTKRPALFEIMNRMMKGEKKVIYSTYHESDNNYQ
ncbi:hypothetical protein PROFUN_13684 [Planoprotostelium fungivorum]|uniref:LRR receptor-like serine/threonine-protein kinase n=1 Tax=Planoprotostelium fungivorum TaxID=1890364 RepID=A0A2P6N3C0_9EUKA|nr:hypothetical protein PROFUN_13684 [Planoprotostelium fungivorum]